MPHPDSSSCCLYPLLRLCGYYPRVAAGSSRTSSRFLPRERNKARSVWGERGQGKLGPWPLCSPLHRFYFGAGTSPGPRG